jgi:hypothetical protein
VSPDLWKYYGIDCDRARWEAYTRMEGETRSLWCQARLGARIGCICGASYRHESKAPNRMFSSASAEKEIAYSLARPSVATPLQRTLPSSMMGGVENCRLFNTGLARLFASRCRHLDHDAQDMLVDGLMVQGSKCRVPRSLTERLPQMCSREAFPCLGCNNKVYRMQQPMIITMALEYLCPHVDYMPSSTQTVLSYVPRGEFGLLAGRKEIIRLDRKYYRT